MAHVGSLLVITGPPGAGKSSVAQRLARRAERSVLVEGDSFFGFLANGAIEPWLPESNEQNAVVTRAAASAAGAFAHGGYATVFDGVVGPWFLRTFGRATGLRQLDYVVLLPPVETCVHRVATRQGHGFTDEAGTRKMPAEFVSAPLAARHGLDDLPDDVDGVAARIASALADGDLSFEITSTQ
jgi:cytidylate kinase